MQSGLKVKGEKPKAKKLMARAGSQEFAAIAIAVAECCVFLLALADIAAIGFPLPLRGVGTTERALIALYLSSMLAFKRILLKLSGEALAGDKGFGVDTSPRP